MYHKTLARRRRLKVAKAIATEKKDKVLGWYNFSLLRKKNIKQWTLRREMIPFYAVFKIIKLVACSITTILYPYYNVNGFPSINSLEIWFLIFLESIFAIEIFINFFLQTLDEVGKSKNLTLE